MAFDTTVARRDPAASETVVARRQPEASETAVAHLYGPAARCKPKVIIWKVGLAHLYPAY
jgi:hypothetical protein